MKKFGVHFLSIFVGLLLIQVIFIFLQGMQSESSEQLIKTLLRQEISSSNNFLISRTLSDLHDSGLIECVQLLEVESNKIFLDLSYKDTCSGQSFFLSGKKVVSKMTSLNGSEWEIHFQSVNGRFFYISLWLSRIFLSLAIVAIILMYRSREKKLSKESSKKIALKELADQAAHDVGSPLSLLNSIVASDLVQGDTKEYLKIIRDRVLGIVHGLKEQSNRIENEQDFIIERVDIDSLLVLATDEKRSLYQNIQLEINSEGSDCLCNRADVVRVFSNILNNAIEASKNGTPILVQLTSREDQLLVTIKDLGVGIPENILSRLGGRGASYGKSNGSGLGLHHALTSMKQWGGDLRISSREGFGTEVCLVFRR